MLLIIIEYKILKILRISILKILLSSVIYYELDFWDIVKIEISLKYYIELKDSFNVFLIRYIYFDKYCSIFNEIFKSYTILFYESIIYIISLIILIFQFFFPLYNFII